MPVTAHEMLVTIEKNTTHRLRCNKGSSTVITKYQMRRRRGRISAAVQSVCSSSSRGCIGNSKRPISDDIARMAQPPVGRCMSRNIRTLAFGGLQVTLCCNYWGAGLFLHYRSVVRPESLSTCLLRRATKFSLGVPLPRVTWVGVIVVTRT